MGPALVLVLSVTDMGGLLRQRRVHKSRGSQASPSTSFQEEQRHAHVVLAEVTNASGSPRPCTHTSFTSEQDNRQPASVHSPQPPSLRGEWKERSSRGPARMRRSRCADCHPAACHATLVGSSPGRACAGWACEAWPAAAGPPAAGTCPGWQARCVRGTRTPCHCCLEPPSRPFHPIAPLAGAPQRQRRRPARRGSRQPGWSNRVVTGAAGAAAVVR
mmetsp:Transcript_16715/g.31356  ORF Transcript_16715/g.31356 Transcript_16715/m.31356 type:complete len:217 (+) Transcript_16715:734-1384(+)